MEQQQQSGQMGATATSDTVNLRKAVIGDVRAMQRLVNAYASEGLMLPRSLHSLYENLRDYTVAERDGAVIGCVALHISWENLAEVRSLAVSDEERGQGTGRRLVAAALAEARTFGLTRVFVLTFAAPFFADLGFRLVDKSELPHKIWQECIHCVHFPDCSEVAMMMDLVP